MNKKRAIVFGIGGWEKSDRNAGIRHEKSDRPFCDLGKKSDRNAGKIRPIALSEHKGDLFWDSWMEWKGALAMQGFGMGKAIALFVIWEKRPIALWEKRAIVLSLTLLNWLPTIERFPNRT